MRSFPAEPIESLGYNVAVHGQKGFNGVAILSKRPFDEVIRALPGDDGDVQARYIEAVIPGEHSHRAGGLDLSAERQSAGQRKIRLQAGLDGPAHHHAQGRLGLEEPLVLAGDFNVIPTPLDARTPARWVDDALFQPETRARFRALVHLGFIDAVRALNPTTGSVHILGLPGRRLAEERRHPHRSRAAVAASRRPAHGLSHRQADVRGWEKPSDHVPVVIELDA
jgi:exodeoxyribonuclease III